MSIHYAEGSDRPPAGCFWALLAFTAFLLGWICSGCWGGR